LLTPARAAALFALSAALLPPAARAQTPPAVDPAAAGTPPASAEPAASAPARRRPAPTELPAVQISTQRAGATEERRASTAAKIVIGRDEIEQYGDSSLGDVLRRLPGVTQGGRPGRGGDVRMRGMGSGYTQILIDGQRSPPGFSIDQLSPEMVERIEVLRAPTAETGTRAIAGTINIVLREPMRRLSNDLRAGLSSERGRVSPQATWTRNDTFGEQGTYNLTVNAGQTRQRTDTETRTTFLDAGASTPEVDQLLREQAFTVRDSVSLSGRAQWRLAAGEQFNLQPFLVRSRHAGHSAATLEPVGSPTTPPPYATRDATTGSDYGIARLNAQLVRRIGAQTRIDLYASVGRFESDSFGLQHQFDGAGAPVLTQRSDTSIRDRSASLTGKLMHELGEGHSLVGGWELETVRRAQSGVTDVAVGSDIGGDLMARTRRQALYLQDEWDAAPNWSANLGLRAETIHIHSGNLDAPVDNESRVVSPLAHLVWRFDAPRRDQLRLSLTQSYRAPPLQSLVALPSLNTTDPVPGANHAANPDRAGNPNLKPELARGIDLALERYLSSGGVMSVNLFYRRIRETMRNALALEDVPWADEPRWVLRPQNIGDASTRGVEFDAKFRLTELREGAPPVNLQLNLSLYGSRVDSVPGPDNRIDQQPKATGNFGADYKLPGTAWTVGGTLALTPGYPTRLSELQSQELGPKRVVDAYLLWQIEPATRLRIGFANLVPQDSASTTSTLQDTQLQTVRTVGRTDRVLSLRLEMRL
jgi:iron complex outermembrane receptor protein